MSSTYDNILTIGRNSNDNLMFEGLHGIGKSEIIEAWGKKNGFYVEPLFLSHYEIGDLIGNTYIENKITYSAKPSFLNNLDEAHKQGKHCVLFLDELNRANKDVLDAALQLCLKGELSTHQLPILNGKKTFIVAAMNPSQYYQVNELDPALLDRFTLINFVPIFKEWVIWAKENNIHPIIIDFLTHKQKYFHNFKEVYNVEGANAATPRSWSKLSDIIYELEKSNLIKELLFTMAYGRIGAIATEFEHFYNNYGSMLSKKHIYKAFNKKIVKEQMIEEFKTIILNYQPSVSSIMELCRDIFKDLNEQKYIEIFSIFLHALPLEIVTAVIKDLKILHKENYFTLYNFDKALFTKIATLMLEEKKS